MPVIPFIKHGVKYLLSYLSFIKNCAVWSKNLQGQPFDKKNKKVFYGHLHIPGVNDPASGGIVKFQRLQEVLPNSPYSFNILYLPSSSLPKEWRQLLWLARRKEAKLVINQNGVWHPKHGAGWEISNLPIKRLVHEADYVFYQSRFCQESVDRFLGKRKGPHEILYNCVDVDFFSPGKFAADPKEIILLLGGNHCEQYRVETALMTLALVAKEMSNIHLHIAGDFVWMKNKDKARQKVCNLIHSLGVSGKVKLLGPYCQADAPQIFRSAHLLLHTQHNDASPGLVVEAMSSGLPVVYPHSGGVPELVGDDAGIGVPIETSWTREIRPDPKDLAQAILEVIDNRKTYSSAARQRAVDNFDLNPWIRRHQEIFDFLLQN